MHPIYTSNKSFLASLWSPCGCKDCKYILLKLLVGSVEGFKKANDISFLFFFSLVKNQAIFFKCDPEATFWSIGLIECFRLSLGGCLGNIISISKIVNWNRFISIKPSKNHCLIINVVHTNLLYGKTSTWKIRCLL